MNSWGNLSLGPICVAKLFSDVSCSVQRLNLRLVNAQQDFGRKFFVRDRKFYPRLKLPTGRLFHKFAYVNCYAHFHGWLPLSVGLLSQGNKWCPRRDLNAQPTDYESAALTN